ncbi:LacI family DNA-binding transcriptional regulator [Actinomadura sp. HBU206391]|uniref:LacI family DNA-binding transcriptional regulator n=1 Tax=Actinomadura sp. HBU206391 TaxID=2731692 RepID=UPI0016506383|nr:LacI family DNA-binding transcriptional regulator [Actinomadura sp. HBU206391]MBC6461130.1 LacI family DNA-binding transcriptional regulator [Actinomadura sp. HBU206391]
MTVQEPVVDQEAVPTLAHVAKLAGVSPATASRVINGSARVSHGARTQVEEAVRRLGYVRRPAASTPPGRRRRSIAAVICEDSERIFTDPFFARLLWGVRRELDGGPQLVVLMVGRAEEWRAVADYVRGGDAAGVLQIGMHSNHPFALLHATTGIPVVLAGRPASGTPLPYVDADNRGGSRAAVEYLARSGRRVIGTIAGPPDMSVGIDRLEGFRAGMGEAGLLANGLVAYGDFRQASGEHAMNHLLDRRPDLDAVLVASDLMAVGALRALRRAGRRVPEDVAVIGFDDAPLAQQVRPRLTTVRQPIEDMGARMAAELLRRIAGKPSPDNKIILKTKLIIRDSA